MKTAITTTDPAQIDRMNDIMQQAGQAANETAARHAFADNPARKSNNTVRRKISDLTLFETFLQSASIPVAGLYENPHAWRGITWGIVDALDCRHYAATFEARKGTPVDRIVDMFGWNSPAMAFRYNEAAQSANEGTARLKQT